MIASTSETGRNHEAIKHAVQRVFLARERRCTGVILCEPRDQMESEDVES